MADGHLNKCKECACRDVRENRKAKIEYYVAYDRGRIDNVERREARNAAHRVAAKADPDRFAGYARRSAQKYPEKRAARVAVGNAIRDGRLFKEPCGKCGSEKAQAHHDDYSKPLEVRWLCPRCHGLEHRKER
jgi:ribosomal protein S27AE